MYRKIETVITESIKGKFAEPQIKLTLMQVAEGQANKIITEQITPQINQAGNKIKNFENYLGEMKNKFSNQYEDMAKQVTALKRRNEITELGDIAIANGSSAAYEQLSHLLNDSTTRQAGLAELFRVKGFYLGGTKIDSVELVLTMDGKTYKNKEITTYYLMDGIKSLEGWQFRARAAQLLRTRKEKGVPKLLLDVAEHDVNLDVRKEAILSFDSVTGHKNVDVLDAKSMSAWWKDNEEKVEKTLKDVEIPESVKKQKLRYDSLKQNF